MARVLSDTIVTAIDVGTTKICVLIAKMFDGGRSEVIGIGKAPSDGLRKGVVFDVGRTVASIFKAVQEAEVMAGVSVESAYIGISGAHVQSVNSLGVVPIKSGEITQHDMQNALAAARAIVLPEGYHILHVLPQYFVIDGHHKVADPTGMYGVRLEVQAHIIMGALGSVQNLIKCCQSAGVATVDIVLEQLASADAVLSIDERELGVAILDIGGGTSDLAIYQGGAIRHTKVLPVAGNHVTNDLAVGLRMTIKDAERIKKEYGCVVSKLSQEDHSVPVESVQRGVSVHVSLFDIMYVVRSRAYELLSLIHQEITIQQLQGCMNAGLVLTGGGSLLMGMPDLARDIFNVPVRIGNPHPEHQVPESINSPLYATGYGLLIHAAHKKNSMNRLSGPLLFRIFSRMKSWVTEHF